MPTAIATPVDERVALTFASQGNASTKWIEISYPTDAPPTALLDALAKIGFTEQDGMVSMPPMPAYDYDMTRPVGEQRIDLGYRVQEVHLIKRGTGLFGGWSEQEAASFLREARTVLRNFGFTRVPVWKKTLADMM